MQHRIIVATKSEGMSDVREFERQARLLEQFSAFEIDVAGFAAWSHTAHCLNLDVAAARIKISLFVARFSDHPHAGEVGGEAIELSAVVSAHNIAGLQLA